MAATYSESNMSIEMKRLWSLEVEESEAGEGNKNFNEKKQYNNRDNSGSRKKSKPNTELKSKQPKKPVELETDTDVLQRRQKQIDYGKNTTGYHNYMQQVPMEERTKNHPKTPEKYTKYSRRSWDMLIKMWRKQLHEYDTSGSKNDVEDDEGSIVSGSSNE